VRRGPCRLGKRIFRRLVASQTYVLIGSRKKRVYRAPQLRPLRRRPPSSVRPSPHLGDRHAYATLGKIYCQANPDRTTPDDQDLGVDATGHERTVKTMSTADIDTVR
jgi:hypothetical protein